MPIRVFPHKAQSGAPFAAGAANNGLSVDPITGKIVLGDDGTGLADLLSNRIIGGFHNFILSLTGQFGGMDLGEASITIGGDESNGVPPQVLFSDVNNANNQGVAGFFQSVGETLFANINFAGGNTTGIGCERQRVRVSNALTFPPGAATGALLEIGGAVNTSDPGSGIGVWKLGKVIAAGVALDATRYVEVDIDGTIVKLAIVV